MEKDFVRIRGKKFNLWIPSDMIQKRVASVAGYITDYFKAVQSSPIFLIVANGAMMFGIDLIRKVDLTCEVHCVRMSSYQGGMQSTGEVKEVMGIDCDVRGRDVVIVEDIIDSGLTMHNLVTKLQEMGARVKICSLLYKPDACKYTDAAPYWSAYDITNSFVVGYGMDYQELGRNLESIYVEESQEKDAKILW